MGHLFDWKNEWTDDPRWAGKLASGKHNRVLLNGVAVAEYQLAMRFRTGPDGWIEYAKRHPRTGLTYVEVWDATTQRVVPCVGDGPQVEGGWRDWYEERLAQGVMHGHVEFMVLDEHDPLLHPASNEKVPLAEQGMSGPGQATVGRDLEQPRLQADEPSLVFLSEN